VAILREQHAERREPLPARAMVGRAPGCDLVLARKSISGHHAVIQWTGSHWEVMDLGSRNGTSVDGKRLGVGERAAVVVGAVLRFGRDAAPWQVEDDGPPRLMAKRIDSGELVLGEGSYLVLPSVERPELGVFQDEHGRWCIDAGDGVSTTEDRAVLTTAGGAAWRLHLPTSGDQTVNETGGVLMVTGLRLRFAVSLDEEHVEAVAIAAGRSFDLKARSHHYPLLVLARRRLADRAAGAPSAEEGWVRQDELIRMLRVDDNNLNICIHRARTQLSKLGMVDAAALVERRSGARLLRIGVSELEVVTLGAPTSG
jgi:hypothetical protein